MRALILATSLAFSDVPADVLERDQLVAEVLASNPTLDAARQAWRAARAEPAQVTSLDDPMVRYQLAPLSIPGLSDAPFGQEVMITQPLPFPGKLAHRGAAARAEAGAVRADVDDARLSLALLASLLHADYFENAQALAVNEEHRALLTAIRGALQGRFEAGAESLQAPLGAELELVNVERDRVRLMSARDVVITRINELLHRPPAAPLPPPAALPAVDVARDDLDVLVAEAVASRPDLAALRARIAAAAARVDSARAEWWPDFSVAASYNSMWPGLPHQFMIGGSIEVPLQIGRRAAAVEQAESRRRQADAELLSLLDAVRAEVAAERRRTLEAREIVRLFDERTLPLAQAAVDAARAGLEPGRTSFLALLDAERALRSAKLDRAAAVAAQHRQIARLERALGRAPTPAAGEGHGPAAAGEGFMPSRGDEP